MKKRFTSLITKCCLLLASLYAKKEAKADGLFGDMTDFNSLCFDASRLGSVVQLYNSSFATQAASSGVAGGLALSASILSRTVPDICSLILAISEAKDTKGVLSAARQANEIADLGLDASLGFMEDTLDTVTFAQELSSSKASLKDKLLNANNHRRFTNYFLRYIEPALCKVTTKTQGLPGSGCINKQVIQETMQLSQARALKAAAIRSQIYSCRVDLPAQESAKAEERKSFANLFGGETARYNKNLQLADQLEQRADAYRRLLIQMVGKVAGNNRELEAMTALINDLPNQSWVSISYKLPYSEKELANPENYDSSLENGRPVCSKPGNRCLLTPPKDTKKKESRRDTKKMSPEDLKFLRSGKNNVPSMAGRKFQIQSAPSIGCTDRATQDFNVFIRQPQEALSSPFVDKSVVARTIESCPRSAGDILRMPVPELVRSVDANESASVSRSQALTRKDICRLQQTQAALKALQRVDSVGGPYTVTIDKKCQRPDNEVAAERKIDGAPLLEFSNLAALVDNYNSLFNTYVAATYRIGTQNNPISDALRRSGNAFNALGSDAGRNNRQSGFSSSARTYTSDQESFLATWRPITSCDDPEYLARRYPDLSKTIESSSSSIDAFSSLIEKCRMDEGNPANNTRAFKDAFNGYIGAITQRTKTNVAVARFQVQNGILTGVLDERRQPVCQKDLNQLAFARTTAELAELQLEAMNSVVNSLNALLIKAESEEAQKRKELEDLEKFYIMNGNRMNRINEYLINSENSRLYDTWDGISAKELQETMPDTMTQKGMKEKYGK